MLAGTQPERILCLTYTKAAAAEMSKRVFDTLAQWVTMPDADAARHDRRTLRPPAARRRARPRPHAVRRRHRDARAASRCRPSTPSASACCSAFRSRPACRRASPILDEETARAAARGDRRHAAGGDGRLIAGAAEGAARRHSLRRRGPLRRGAARRAAISGGGSQRHAHRPRRARRRASPASRPRIGAPSACARRRPSTTVDSDMADVIGDAELVRLRDALSGGSATDQKMAQHVAAALAARTSAGARRGAGEILLHRRQAAQEPDDQGHRRRSIPTSMPRSAWRRRASWRSSRSARGLRAVDATIALHRLAGAVLQRYTHAKARRAALDFDDLIAKSVLPARRPGAGGVGAVQARPRPRPHPRRRGQDTSPAQWQVVEALAREFFSGDAGARSEVRTLFAVGDEKQSIYCFQGAEPAQVRRHGPRLRRHGAQPPGSTGSASRSTCRSAPSSPVLAAVDAVFADRSRTPGLTSRGRHRAPRRAAHGACRPRRDLADRGERTMTPTVDAWSPLDEEAARAPAERLAERIAATIRGWLDSGEMLASEGRPIRAGDILILVRKRRPFAGADGGRAEGARHRRRRRRPPAPQRPDRRRGSAVARRLPDAAGGRPGAGRGAEEPDLRLRRRRSAGPRRRPQGHAVEGAARPRRATTRATAPPPTR